MAENALKLNLLVYGIAALVIGIPAVLIGRDLLTTEALVGQCASQVANVSELRFEETGCKKRKNSPGYEVGAIAANCPDGDYIAVPRGGEKTCYLSRAAIGVCFVTKQYPNVDQPVHIRGNCEEQNARKSVDVLHDTFDKSRCPGPDLALAYSKPARTLCLEKA
ncbi:hypothetical protein [Lentzea xinjiangensis]|uniref:hypothetical protein n=1 Tax=Lentzea xinjiangensis TaxID=402600 RepID=UPI000B7DEE63|nr:hypothetical protein [Lentzea xinjiangensis]